MDSKSTLAELRGQFQQRLERVRHDDDGGRERHCAKLLEIMEAMYEADMEQRKAELILQTEKLARLKESQAFRKEHRERIVQNEFKRFTEKESQDTESEEELFSFDKPPGIQLQVISDRTVDGTRKMKIHAVSLRRESRARQVPFIREVKQSRQNTIDGKKIDFTVVVPESRIKEEVIEVDVPVWRTLEIEVPNGEDWEEVARGQLR